MPWRPKRPFWNPMLEILSNPAIPYPAILLEIASNPIHPMLTAAASSHAFKTAPQRSPSGRLRNSKTPWPWRTERTCGQRPPVPNVAFWTNKKPAPKCSSHALKTAPQRSPSGRLRSSKTPWPWRTERPPNQSQEQVSGGRNVPSEILLEILSYPSYPAIVLESFLSCYPTRNLIQSNPILIAALLKSY